MDKYRFFAVFSVIAFGSRDTLRHCLEPLLSTLDSLDNLKRAIFASLKDNPIDASPEIFQFLDFESFEKARLGYHSVGVSLIICFSELIKRIADERSQSSRHFGLSTQKSFEFYKLGPQINGIPWAEAVVCASNYVRHDDEWKQLVTPNAQREDGLEFNISYDNIDWNSVVASFPSDPKRNVCTLNGVGIPFEIFLKYHSMAGFEIGKALYLFEGEKSQQLFDEWVTAVVNDLMQSLGIS